MLVCAMSRIDFRNVVIVLLLALFVWVAVDGSAQARTDGGGGDHDRGLIAVTGAYGSNASALYLIDTRTRHMSVYRLENGRALEFVAARDCTYDFYIETYNDRSDSGFKPRDLRRSWERYGRRGLGSPDEPATTPPSDKPSRIEVGPKVKRIDEAKKPGG